MSIERVRAFFKTYDMDGRILEFPVSGEKIEAVHMLPGYTHSIVNCSETKELITLMWANEAFDPEKPDTFAEPVGIQKEEKKNGA